MKRQTEIITLLNFYRFQTKEKNLRSLNARKQFLINTLRLKKVNAINQSHSNKKDQRLGKLTTKNFTGEKKICLDLSNAI